MICRVAKVGLLVGVLGVAAATRMSTAAAAADGFLVRDGDRVVFYGDSITDSEWYPMTLTRPIELQPHLAIARSGAAPQLAGKLSEWQDATTVALDRLDFVDPAVPGKKLLWGGPADLSAQVFLTWDDAALYVAALVRDDEHVQNATEMMTWSDADSQPGKGFNYLAWTHGINYGKNPADFALLTLGEGR